MCYMVHMKGKKQLIWKNRQENRAKELIHSETFFLVLYLDFYDTSFGEPFLFVYLTCI